MVQINNYGRSYNYSVNTGRSGSTGSTGSTGGAGSTGSTGSMGSMDGSTYNPGSLTEEELIQRVIDAKYEIFGGNENDPGYKDWQERQKRQEEEEQRKRMEEDAYNMGKELDEYYKLSENIFKR